MANRDVHMVAGAVAGGAAAAYLARDQQFGYYLLELAGGAAAGIVGAQLPDIFDPPTHPGHRSLGHGLVPAGAALTAVGARLDRAQRQLRQTAERHRAARESATALERLWHWLMEILSRFAAGAVAGLAAGYASHLALDAFTPRSLPIFA